MDATEYRKNLKRALKIMADIEQMGVMGLAMYKNELMQLAPAVLKEAAKREGLTDGG